MCVHGRLLRCVCACVRAWRGVSAADAVSLWGAQHKLPVTLPSARDRAGLGWGQRELKGLKTSPGRLGMEQEGWGCPAARGLSWIPRGVGVPRPLPHPQQLPGVLQTTGHSRAGLGYGGVDGKVWGILTFPMGQSWTPGLLILWRSVHWKSLQ